MEYQRKSARLPRSAEEKVGWKRVIIILEHCPLQSIQTDKGFELLSERHRSYHAKRQQDPAEWRPDVVHQCLLHLQDSALNRAGMLEVYLRTKKGVCIAVDPRLKVPRHIRLFEKMFVSLLFKMKIRASTGYLSLLRVVKNPITDHIPPNTVLYRVEKDGAPITNLLNFCDLCGTDAPHWESASPPTRKRARSDTEESPAQQGPSTSAGIPVAGSSAFADAARREAEKQQFKPFAFVVGGMSKGDVSADYAAANAGVRSIRLGDRGMSAAAVVSKLLFGFEEAWLKEDNELC